MGATWPLGSCQVGWVTVLAPRTQNPLKVLKNLMKILKNWKIMLYKLRILRMNVFEYEQIQVRIGDVISLHWINSATDPWLLRSYIKCGFYLLKLV